MALLSAIAQFFRPMVYGDGRSPCRALSSLKCLLRERERENHDVIARVVIAVSKLTTLDERRRVLLLNFFGVHFSVCSVDRTASFGQTPPKRSLEAAAGTDGACRLHEKLEALM